VALPKDDYQRMGVSASEFHVIELAIKSQRVFALETDAHPSPQRFLWPAFRQELLKHDGGFAKFKPTPANSPVRMVFGAVGNPVVLSF
jgi:hypothetical protein